MKLFSLLLLFGILFAFVSAAEAGDEVEINNQLSEGGHVVLDADRVYTITDSIVFTKSNTVLSGQPGTKITIPKNCDWKAWKPIIDSTNLDNLVVENLEIDGKSDDQTVSHGKGFHNAWHPKGCNNVTMRNCLLHDSKGDGMRAKSCTNVFFYENTAYKLGHDCFYGIDSQGVKVFDNRLTTRSNSAVRIWNSKDVRIYNNTIDAQKDSMGGYPGIQIEDSKGTLSNIEVCGNAIKQTWGPGMWVISYEGGNQNAQDLWIHHNLFYQTGISYNIGNTAGISDAQTEGNLIENNVFDGCYNAAYECYSTRGDTEIKNNIITSTQKHIKQSREGTGNGIINKYGADISISGNCFYENAAGNCYKCTSSETDSADPKKHITSSGWTWNEEAGNWECEGVPPTDLDNITPMTRGDIEDTDTHEVVFDDIFDILSVSVSDDVNMTSSMPDEYEPVNSVDVMILNNTYNPQTRYDVADDNYTLKVSYGYDGKRTWHFIRASVSGDLEEVDTWRKADGMGRMGNSFVLPFAINPEEASDVRITVYDAFENKHVIENYNVTVYDEDLKDAVNPLAYFMLMFLLICGGCFYINVKSVYRRKMRKW